MKKEEEIPREILMYKRDRRFNKALAGVPEWKANEEDKDGILKITIPKSEKVKINGKKIEIR